MKQCKCEHWEQCPVCMPHRFDAEGNLLPPEPTPLQACRAQVTALTSALFQAQEAAKALANLPQRTPLTDAEIDSFREKNSEGRGAGWRFNFKDFARAIERAHGIGEKE